MLYSLFCQFNASLPLLRFSPIRILLKWPHHSWNAMININFWPLEKSCVLRLTKGMFWCTCELLATLVTKLVETLFPKGPFWHFANSKREKCIFSFPIPFICNVVSLAKLLVENNKHPKFEWRGEGLVWVVLFSEANPIQGHCINNLVVDCSCRC